MFSFVPSPNQYDMAQEKQLHDLVSQCIALMTDSGFSKTSINKYKGIWKSHVEPFMESHGTLTYCPELGLAFLKSQPEDRLSVSNSWRRAITILDSVLSEGKIRRVEPQKGSFDFSGEIGEIALAFLQEKKASLISKKTVYAYDRMMGRIVTFLRIKGVTTIDFLSESILLEFLSSSQYNPSQRNMVVRGFCKYLASHKIKSDDFGTLIRGFKFPIREKLPSIYTDDEIDLIGKTINQSYLGARRLYAAFLLASRLGMRVSDIVNLSFKNIDWDKNTIRITQFKTGKYVELPLLKDVGNAIIDYLRTERPKSDNEHVFLTLKAPIQPVSTDTIKVGFAKAVRESGVMVGRRHKGIHSMRHSLASELLREDTELPVISSILGHASTNSTMNYLRVDLGAMAKCLLHVPPIPDEFYEQKGGIFYD